MNKLHEMILKEIDTKRTSKFPQTKQDQLDDIETKIVQSKDTIKSNKQSITYYLNSIEREMKAIEKMECERKKLIKVLEDRCDYCKNFGIFSCTCIKEFK